ncbi:gluconokinase [Marinicrinis sediminis]|uniref:Gluconokinase n=1 Tax=Marinicrinis sediminis TaxID=1652465 RepID=A0ABW5R6U5_9BACL
MKRPFEAQPQTNAEQSVVLAVDIGTTSTKALIVSREGEVHATHSVKYPLHVPRPGYAEQDPAQIAEAALEAIRNVMRTADVQEEQILCVSFSSAMHSLIAMDASGNPLTSCITWADQRAVHQVNELKANGLGLEIYRRTGTPVHPMSPLYKIKWMREHDDEVFRQTRKFIGIKEYVCYQWFDQYVIDYSLASATGLFNLEQLTWDSEALSVAGIEEGQLSQPVPTTQVLRGMKASVKEQLGLTRDIPVVVGASDGVLANLGLGILDQQVAAVTIGTSGAVRTTLKKPQTHPQGDLFCYCLTEDYWVTGGAVNNGGVALQWVQDLLQDEQTSGQAQSSQEKLERLNEWAAETAPGADGLLCIPLFTGERAPDYNANARGVFFGLTLSHKQRHMVRAVMEGVLFQLERVIRSVEQVGGSLTELRASGGFANSLVWRQMMADISGVETLIPDEIESSGLGAAQLGLFAMGVTSSLDAGWSRQAGSRYTVNADHHEIYTQLLPIYLGVYERLGDSFEQITAFQKSRYKPQERT